MEGLFGMLMALVLDLANILGGFLLAIALLRRIPRIGGGLDTFATRVAPYGWIVGVVALVAGGYYLLVHLAEGPHVFHFEIVGIAVGLALLWDRLTGRKPAEGGPTGAALLLAVLGLIAIVVGIQGLFTSD